jgi:hypothetical protein
MDLFYIIVPERADFLKLGRWTGSVSKLISRYKTYYGQMETFVFQCDDSVSMEKEAFGFLALFRWKGELFEKACLSAALEFAGSSCLPSVEARDFLARMEEVRLRRTQREELMALRLSFQGPPKTAKEGTLKMTHSERVAATVMDGILQAVDRQIDIIEMKREKERIAQLEEQQQKDSVTAWLRDNVISGDATDFVTKTQLYARFRGDVKAEQGRSKKMGEGRFFELAKEHLGSTEGQGFYEKKRPMGRQIQVRNYWVGRRLVDGLEDPAGGDSGPGETMD